ncbi:MAG: DUF488 domain-containing protein [Deltaproteobacteria bacterium]|nr:DUF488 domain-containing protein [Deltaproteobacteria bacterium]
MGFTKKTAEEFFTRLARAKVRRIIDIRLNNVSQLAGFAKRDDLRYFLRTIGGIDYVHRPDLAPTQDILDAYKKNKGDWSLYEQDFLALLSARKVADKIQPDLLQDACLLCSEAKPLHCHRRLVAEYIHEKWPNIEIHHID